MTRTALRAGGPLALAAWALGVAAPGVAQDDKAAVPSEPAAAQPGPGEAVRATEAIVVTARRLEQPLSEAPPGLVVLSAEDLQHAAAPTLDDALRLVPGFNLFRRTGSRVANPTSQGVSLRGLGPSGASRALVLVDGLPLNDPFGGWVTWGFVPKEAIDRVEVLRGAASDLYGSAALGGVIQVITRNIGPRPDASLEASLGNAGTAEGSLTAGGRRDGWGGRVSAGALATDGHVLVEEAARGPVDTAAGVRQASLDLTLDRALPHGRVFLRGRFLGESRANGTPLQSNRTHVNQAVAGFDHEGVGGGRLSLRAHAGAQVYNQSFTAVAADRASETLTRLQRVPAQDTGLSAQWSRSWGRHHAVAGILGREVRGASDEVAFAAGAATSTVGAGGRERTLSAFAADQVRLHPRVHAGLAVRYDRWGRSRALSVTTPLAGGAAPATTALPDHDESSLNPRLSLRVVAGPRLDLGLAAYRSFRGPTLNELFRSFRVGDTLTLANAELRAERLSGGEAGAVFRGRVASVSATGFWAEVRDPVANVTLAVAPRLVTRQRQNLGRTRSRGVELDADVRLGRVRLRGGYALTDGRVTRFPASPELVGRLLPQLPRHQASLRVSYEAARFEGAAALRVVGAQFEDDRNELRLRGFAVVDLRAGLRLGAAGALFVAAENLFDRRYPVGLVPTPTIGPPRLVRVGARVGLGAVRSSPTAP